VSDGSERRALIAVPVAPLTGEPRISSPQISQRLSGHAVEVLEVREDWLHVRGDDGYEGWIHRGYVASPDTREETGLLSGVSGRRFCSLGSVTLGFDGRRRLLPLGAWLLAGERCVGGDVVEEPEIERRFPRNAAAVSLTAAGFFEGTSYEWGGITPWGADCSGMVQTAFWLHGLQLPRDASQQALIGYDAGRDPKACHPGDLLFFSDRPDRTITHVGIALGEGRMVHCGLGRGGWAIENFADDAPDDYARALTSRFLFARRPAFTR